MTHASEQSGGGEISNPHENFYSQRRDQLNNLESTANVFEQTSSEWFKGKARQTSHEAEDDDQEDSAVAVSLSYANNPRQTKYPSTQHRLDGEKQREQPQTDPGNSLDLSKQQQQPAWTTNGTNSIIETTTNTCNQDSQDTGYQTSGGVNASTSVQSSLSGSNHPSMLMLFMDVTGNSGAAAGNTLFNTNTLGATGRLALTATQTEGQIF